MSNLRPCGTRAARRRHTRAGETCETCTQTVRQLAPCGTPSARKRHNKRGETCTTCAPKPVNLKPCGTNAAYRRHKKHNEPVCPPCKTANDAYEAARRQRARGGETSDQAANLIEDITFLLNCGEGEHAILKAIGYQGRTGSLRDRLKRNGRADLYQRITNSYELAA